MPSKGTTNSVDIKSADKMPGAVSTQKTNTYEKGAEFKRRIDKSKIPTCKILGVDIAAIDMNWLLKYTSKNLEKLRGDYMCVVNVYSDVTAYNDPEFCEILNSSALCMPDGGPLSTVGRHRGYKKMQRTTGPGYMGEIFKMSAQHGWKHLVKLY